MVCRVLKKTVILAALLSGLVSNSWAQDAGKSNEGAASEQGENSREEKKQKKSKPKKVFKPSEEISEDSPVPFPVDI